MRFLICLAALVSGALASPTAAQTRETPYWATIRDSATVLNMRVGPSKDYKIAWVYRRPGLPVKVVRVLEGWRLIEDPHGDQGWVSAPLLSPARGIIVTGEEPAAIRASGANDADIRWRAAPGVVAKLERCEEGWCQIDVDGRRGWVRQGQLWGSGEP